MKNNIKNFTIFIIFLVLHLFFVKFVISFLNFDCGVGDGMELGVCARARINLINNQIFVLTMLSILNSIILSILLKKQLRIIFTYLIITSFITFFFYNREIFWWN